MHELPVSLEACSCLPFFRREAARFRYASWFDLVHSFLDGSDLNKKQKEDKRLLFLNPSPLFYVHRSSVSTIIMQMKKE